jgi:hypothetical protein
MLTPIAPPAEEFRQLTELEVEAALRFTEDPDKNPIVGEVFRLTRAYGDAMVEVVALYGHVPDDFALAPRYPVEVVAAKLFKQEIDEYAKHAPKRAANDDTEQGV